MHFFLFFLGDKDYYAYICSVFRMIHIFLFAQISSRTTTSTKKEKSNAANRIGVHSLSVSSP